MNVHRTPVRMTVQAASPSRHAFLAIYLVIDDGIGLLWPWRHAPHSSTIHVSRVAFFNFLSLSFEPITHPYFFFPTLQLRTYILSPKLKSCNVVTVNPS